jgi:transcriptional regulator with XRE-family HTH domain
MSQEQFAHHVDMARTYFAEVETGKRNVSIRNLKKITNGLDVSLAEFFSSELF